MSGKKNGSQSKSAVYPLMVIQEEEVCCYCNYDPTNYSYSKKGKIERY